MPQLAKTRIGWENENLAAFLLSRFAFISSPVSVGDDAGSDFFCTVFEKLMNENQIEMLYPRSAFAIQIKTNKDEIEVGGNVEYFQKLELPFFVGVVDQASLKMKIYSGEYIPFYFSHMLPVLLSKFVLEDDEVKDLDYLTKMKGSDKLKLRLPFIMELSATDPKEKREEDGARMLKLCNRIYRNISSKALHEYIFFFNDNGGAVVYVGPGSEAVYKSNFALRLLEALINLERIYDSSEKHVREFKMYEHCYLEMAELKFDTSQFLDETYRRVKSKISP